MEWLEWLWPGNQQHDLVWSQQRNSTTEAYDWNGSRTAVQEVVGKYLARLLVGRNTMLGLDVKATDGDKQMAPPVGPGHDMRTNAASQVAERDTACQCCQLRSSRQHNQMLLCD